VDRVRGVGGRPADDAIDMVGSAPVPPQRLPDYAIKQ